MHFKKQQKGRGGEVLTKQTSMKWSRMFFQEGNAGPPGNGFGGGLGRCGADTRTTIPESSTGAGTTNASFYDVLGRRYYVGVKVAF